MTTKSRRLSLKERGLTNFEAIMWIFTRLSALAIYGLILVGLIGALIMGAREQMNLADVMRWAFMPNVYHVEGADIPDLAPWNSVFWKLTASALLLVAAAHGVHGLVVIVDDYVASKIGRNITRFLSVVFLLAISLMGLWILWT